MTTKKKKKTQRNTNGHFSCLCPVACYLIIHPWFQHIYPLFQTLQKHFIFARSGEGRRFDSSLSFIQYNLTNWEVEEWKKKNKKTLFFIHLTLTCSLSSAADEKSARTSAEQLLLLSCKGQ